MTTTHTNQAKTRREPIAPALAIFLPVQHLDQLRPLLGQPSDPLPVIQA